MTFEVYGELERLAWECQTDERVSVLVITGSGKGFCSGGDVHEIIAELRKRSPKDLLAFTRMTGAVKDLYVMAPLPEMRVRTKWRSGGGRSTGKAVARATACRESERVRPPTASRGGA